MHPGFVDIIKQLTSDEARIVRFLRGQEIPFCDIFVVPHQVVTFPPTELLGPMELFKRSLRNGVTEGKRGITALYRLAGCEDTDIERLDVSASNLERLQLMAFDPPEEFVTGTGGLLDLIAPYRSRLAQRGLNSVVIMRRCRLTPFGSRFVSCCIDDPRNESPPA